MSTSVIGSAAMTTHFIGVGCVVDEIDDALAERVGVREEERRVPAEEQEPGHLLRARIAREVVIALHAVRAAEDGVVRSPRAPDEVEQRHRDGDRDAR